MERKVDTLDQTGVVAIRLADYSRESWARFHQVVDRLQIPWSVHLESQSFLLPIEMLQKFQSEFEFEEVTDIYQELEARKEGYRVIRVTPNVAVNIDGEDKLVIGSAMVIKDYANDVFLQCEYGRVRCKVPDFLVLDELTRGAYTTLPAERPLNFFDTIEEAMAFGKTEISKLPPI